MQNKELLQIVPQEDFSKKVEDYCSKRQTLPLAIFYDSFITDSYNPRKTVEEVSTRVFGPCQMKVVTLQDKSITEQVDYLKALPQSLIQIRAHAHINGYDQVMLFAEQLVKQTGKHVIAMINAGISFSEEQLFSGKLLYWDVAAETQLTWRSRAQVWVADRPCCYTQTRQVYLACLKAGVLDMLKEWMEEGRTDDVIRAVNDNDWLNETYRQYVCSKADVPYVMKYTTYTEKLLVSETETEEGKVMNIQSVSMQDVMGLESRCVESSWRRMTKELKLNC